MLDPIAPVIPKIVRGSAILIPVQLPADQFSGDPIDLSSATEITFSLLEADHKTLVTKTLSGSGGVTDNSALGRFNVALAAADTENLNLSTCDEDWGGSRWGRPWYPGHPNPPRKVPARVTYTVGGLTYIINLSHFAIVVDEEFPGL